MCQRDSSLVTSSTGRRLGPNYGNPACVRQCGAAKNRKDLNLPKQIVADVLSNHEIHSVAFVGCGASMSDLYPAKYFLANNTDKLNVQIFTANEFNYDTPSWVNEHTFVITCSLGGSTPETVEANKTAKKHNCPVVSLTNKAGSALTVDADHVIVHGFHANYAAKCEKPGYASADRRL